eukprot:SAG22_NODE_231_length_14551_cov_22.298090_4_plen_37_part_00
MHMQGPRNLLDQTPLTIAKQAAVAVLDTLTSADRED